MRIRQVKSLVGGETLVEPVITKEKEIILADNVAYTEPMPQEKAKAFLAISILSTHNLPNKHRTTYPKATK